MRFPSPLLLALSLFLLSSLAQASVLLPEETKKPGQTSGSLLGLTPAQPAPSKETDKKAEETLLPQSSKNLPATAAPSLPVKPQNTIITPGGTVAPDKNAIKDKALAKAVANGAIAKNKPKTPFQQKVDAFYKSFHASFARDPTIIDEVPIEPYDSPDLTSLFGVAPAAAYVWGPKDSKVITRSLGYSAEELPNKCQMRFTASLTTEDGGARYRGTVLAGGRLSLKYKTALKSVSFKPSALCVPPATLPRNGSVIMRSGNLLSVQLPSNATCQIPATGVARYLEMAYKGDGAVDCKFY